MKSSGRSPLEHPEIGPRLLALQDRLAALLHGGSPGAGARARAACAMGALFWPVVTLPDTELAAARDTVLQAALGMLPARRRR